MLIMQGFARCYRICIQELQLCLRSISHRRTRVSCPVCSSIIVNGGKLYVRKVLYLIILICHYECLFIRDFYDLSI